MDYNYDIVYYFLPFYPLKTLRKPRTKKELGKNLNNKLNEEE